MNDCKTILLDNHRRPDLKVFVCYSSYTCILFTGSVRGRDLTSGIRAFALCVGSRLINSVRVLVEEFSVVKFKIFEETVKNTKNRKNSSNICFLICFVVDV